MMLIKHTIVALAATGTVSAGLTVIHNVDHKVEHSSTLRYHGSHINTEHKLPVAIYTPYHLGATNFTALSWYVHHNVSMRPHLIHHRKLSEWVNCADWTDDYVGGAAGCHREHSFDRFSHEQTPNTTRSTIFKLLHGTLHDSHSFKTPGSRCAVTQHGRICVSWPAESSHSSGLSTEAAAKIAEYATKCSIHHGASSAFMVDDTSRLWTWVCVSDSPTECKPELCDRMELTAKPLVYAGRMEGSWQSKEDECHADTMRWLKAYVPKWFPRPGLPDLDDASSPAQYGSRIARSHSATR